MAKKPFEDYGRRKVDGQLKDLESRLSAMYDKAGKEVTRDFNVFMSKFNASDILKKEQLQRGEITESQYKDWREAQIFRQDLMKSKIDDLSQKMVNADKEAMAMVNNELPQAYATSYNWGGFRGEKMAEAAGFDYTQFNIVNADAVRILATEDPDLIPWKPMPDEDKDKAWNRKHVQDAIHQGIVQGDSMDKIANRLLPVVNMDKNASIRTARTAVTGVENKARKDATERVREAGIPMVEVWSCTHDSRTRDTHILLDGTEPNDEGLYGEGILDTLLRYPADPSGDPEEVYNCRCGTLSTIKGIDHSKDQELYEQFMSDNYEEDWEKVKEQRREKEEAFQANKAGAAERVEERRQKAEGSVNEIEKPVAPAKTIEEREESLKNETPEMPQSVRDAYDKFEDKYIDSAKEHGILFDKDGNLLSQSQSKRNESVSIASESMYEHLGQGAYEIHNHTADELFSWKDISNYEKYGMNGTITIPSGWEFTLYNSNDPRWNWDDAKRMETEWLASAWSKAQENISDEWTQERRAFIDSVQSYDRQEQRRLVREWEDEHSRLDMQIQWLETHSEEYGFAFEKRRLK